MKTRAGAGGRASGSTPTRRARSPEKRTAAAGRLRHRAPAPAARRAEAGRTARRPRRSAPGRAAAARAEDRTRPPAPRRARTPPQAEAPEGAAEAPSAEQPREKSARRNGLLIRQRIDPAVHADLPALEREHLQMQSRSAHDQRPARRDQHDRALVEALHLGHAGHAETAARVERQPVRQLQLLCLSGICHSINLPHALYSLCGQAGGHDPKCTIPCLVCRTHPSLREVFPFWGWRNGKRGDFSTHTRFSNTGCRGGRPCPPLKIRRFSVVVRRGRCPHRPTPTRNGKRGDFSTHTRFSNTGCRGGRPCPPLQNPAIFCGRL